MPFKSLGLSSGLVKELSIQNYEQATPIQKEAIPAILKGKDLLGIAPTGSGKTAGFVLPILQNLQQKPSSKNRHVAALILVPTRELAVQVNEVFKVFSNSLPEKLKCMAVYGGVSINPQMIKLQGTEILVATPGRLIELVESKAVSLSDVQILVLDEADKMLSLGFKDEVHKILSLLPRYRQNLLFSATLSPEVEKINAILLHDPVVIRIEAQENHIELISQLAYFVSEERKGPLLRYLIKTHNMQQVLVFTASVFESDKVADKLRLNGIPAAAIHGKKSQGAREEALNKFKAGKLRVLVATDLMARGIDIKFLPYVINYELPRSPKDYIHRIGRTGRAESAGNAISLIIPEDQHHFKIIQKKMGKWVTMIDSNDFDMAGY